MLDEETYVDNTLDILSQIYNIIKNQYSTDFSLYKHGTVMRCIERRIFTGNIIQKV